MAASMSHTTPLLCRASFDRLTELSSILVNHGDLLVHSKSRERLQREVDRAENGALEAVLRLISRGAGPSSGAASSGGATGTEVRLGCHVLALLKHFVLPLALPPIKTCHV